MIGKFDTFNNEENSSKFKTLSITHITEINEILKAPNQKYIISTESLRNILRTSEQSKINNKVSNENFNQVNDNAKMAVENKVASNNNAKRIENTDVIIGEIICNTWYNVDLRVAQKVDDLVSEDVILIEDLSKFY